jgi:PAS domain S-box-containing protein
MTAPPAPSARAASLWPELLERQLENAGPGTHICPIYSDPVDRLRVLVAFFGGGLVRGEQCLYIADADRAGEVAQALQALGPPTSTEVDRGSLLLVTTRELYVRGGHFDPQAMFQLHATVDERARSSGYSALRIAGEMSWVLGADMGNRPFLELEALLNETLPAHGSSGICLYDRRATQPSIIRDVLRTHPVAVIGERVHDNVYYEPVDVVLGRGDVDRARADWMVDRLEALTSRKTAVFDVGRLTLEGASPGDLMRAAPAMIAAELKLDYVQLFELLPPGNAARLIGSSGLELAELESVEGLTPDRFMADPALRAGQPVVIYDWQDETRLTLPAALREAGVTSSAAIVIGVGGGARVYGFLTAHSRAPRLFTDDEILFLETVGHLLAYAFAGRISALSFRELVENAPDVIVRFDGDLRIIYANPAVERLTGTATEVLIGKKSSDLGILESLVPTWELLLSQVWRTAREQEFELTVRTATGDRIFDSRIVPEPGADGSMQFVLIIARDVTEQRRAEAERSDLYRQLLEQQNRVLELMGRLAQDPQRTAQRTVPGSQLQLLTERERQILRLLAAGRTNREIAADIGLSAGTVKNQVARILSKLQVVARTQAAVRAVELGLLERAE